LAGNPSFLDALGRVRTTTLAAYAHQDLPFEHVVEALQPQRSLSSSPLFQVLFALQNAPLPALRLGDVTLQVQDTPQTTAKFDLSLVLTETEHGLDALLEYATDLFAEPTIARLAQHFHTLLDAICADPQQPLATLPMLTAAERDQLLTIWNQPTLPVPPAACLHDLVAAQAQRTPDLPALVVGAQTLSYATLNARANQLAHELVTHGVGPEVRVGVYLDRTADLIMALLAVLKAGGCYVPLDPAYPAERIQFMLADTQAPVILTDRQHQALLPEHTAQTICLDTEWPRIAQHASTDPVTAVQPANLAYLIYTSGSTGRPKGVAIAHASAVALLHWAHHTFAAADLAYVAAGTSICFDLSIFELFVPLSCGGTVQLLANALEIPALAATPVTLLNTVPSVIAEVLRSGALPPSVRVINLAGEPLSRALTDALYAAAPTARVYNLYGPSEDTTYSTGTLVPSDDRSAPTIGRPIDHTQAYILDAQLQPVPIGVVGELYLGGAGLARGYLHRPELTAEKFIPDPFSANPGGRLYRTGDLARYLPDGNIVFLGRSDHQVKVRGFRIELGEIEAALRQHPAVSEAVVSVLNESSDARLVAYVVENQEPRTKNLDVEPGASPSPVATEVEADRGSGKGVAEPGVRASEGLSSTLRAFLRDRLPEYMIPSLVVPLETIPLTPSGKIDRKALPAPDGERPDLTATFVAPRTPTEERVAQIWQDVLGLERVGIYDNFFDIGGHSLLATQIMTRIRTTFQVNPALRALFEQPTVAYLAQIIEQEIKQPAPPARSKIQALPRRGGSRQLADKLDRLSDQEIERLLQERKTAQTGESSHD
ncbi:MAG TPA: amino acid adenylation domain-containing protein, partial [Herpetosiphonaceae bacterium]